MTDRGHYMLNWVNEAEFVFTNHSDVGDNTISQTHDIYSAALYDVTNICGFLLPTLMVMRILPPGFLFGFLSWTSSVSGLFLGVIAVALMTQTRE